LHVLLDNIPRIEDVNANSHINFDELNDDINTKPPLEKNKQCRPIFNQINFNVNVVSFLVIIVTVGVINPILGFLMCICLSINIHTNLSVLGNHIKNTKHEKQRQQLVDIYERDCKGAIESIRLCKRILIPVMGIFFAPFIIDIIGFSKGYKSSLFPFFQMILFPFEFWLIRKFYNYIYKFNKNNADRNISIENPLL
jgi:hypothetical protein